MSQHRISCEQFVFTNKPMDRMLDERDDRCVYASFSNEIWRRISKSRLLMLERFCTENYLRQNNAAHDTIIGYLSPGDVDILFEATIFLEHIFDREKDLISVYSRQIVSKLKAFASIAFFVGVSQRVFVEGGRLNRLKRRGSNEGWTKKERMNEIKIKLLLFNF